MTTPEQRDRKLMAILMDWEKDHGVPVISEINALFRETALTQADTQADQDIATALKGEGVPLTKEDIDALLPETEAQDGGERGRIFELIREYFGEDDDVSADAIILYLSIALAHPTKQEQGEAHDQDDIDEKLGFVEPTLIATPFKAEPAQEGEWWIKQDDNERWCLFLGTPGISLIMPHKEAAEWGRDYHNASLTTAREEAWQGGLSAGKNLGWEVGYQKGLGEATERERERCAGICDEKAKMSFGAEKCAAAIREGSDG